MKEDNMNKFEHYLLDLNTTAEILSWFIFDDKGVFPKSELVYNLYPSLVGKIDIKDNDVKSKIGSLIEEKYLTFNNENRNLIDEYDGVIKKYFDNYLRLLNDYFNIDKKYNIKIGIGLIPVFPRDILEETYCVGKVSEEIVIDVFMHEVCHFAFFDKCSKIFSNFSEVDMNSPSLLWYLSEMVIDPILNRDEFQSIFNHEFKAYNNFYNIKVNGKFVMDELIMIFNNNDCEDAIIKSYNYLFENEEKFRRCFSDDNREEYKKLVRGDCNQTSLFDGE